MRKAILVLSFAVIAGLMGLEFGREALAQAPPTATPPSAPTGCNADAPVLSAGPFHIIDGRLEVQIPSSGRLAAVRSGFGPDPTVTICSVATAARITLLMRNCALVERSALDPESFAALSQIAASCRIAPLLPISGIAPPGSNICGEGQYRGGQTVSIRNLLIPLPPGGDFSVRRFGLFHRQFFGQVHHAVQRRVVTLKPGKIKGRQFTGGDLSRTDQRRQFRQR